MTPSPSEHAQWFADQVRPHEPALRAYLRRQFPTLRDVDDLVQETYARLLRARHAGAVDRPRSLLFVTARNAALDLFRRNQVVRFEQIEETHASSVVEERPDAAEAAAHEQELQILTAAIRALPERCRQVLTLRKLHGLSHREIALRLGISEHTVNAQIATGVARCRQYLRHRGVLTER